MVNGAPLPSLRHRLIGVPDHAVREPRAVRLLSEDHEGAPRDSQLRARIGDPFPGVRLVAATSSADSPAGGALPPAQAVASKTQVRESVERMVASRTKRWVRALDMAPRRSRCK